MNIKSFMLAAAVLFAGSLFALEREFIWPEGKMPHENPRQFARMTDEMGSTNRVAYLEWREKPANFNGGVVIMISGGAYCSCCDIWHVRKGWPEFFEGLGFQTVNLCYRTPRSVQPLPIYQAAWDDGQRAVKMVRSEAAKRGYDPEKIGVISMSAGSHLATLLATSSQTPAYEPIDELDKVPCHINFAITGAIAYGLTTSAHGNADKNAGVGGVPMPEFKFDAKTCPMCMLHGGADNYSPLASTQIYRKLRIMKVPAEVHLYADQPHGGFWKNKCEWEESALGFIRQLNLDGKLGEEVSLMDRFPYVQANENIKDEDIWPEGKMPNALTNQCNPHLWWHFPKVKKTNAIQIIYSGGAYWGNDPQGFEVAPAQRYLNEKGMTVVTMRYRCPNENRAEKHLRPWQDLQRAIRIVRSEAPKYGLDPDRIGIMGSSAGGHLTLMGVTSSTVPAYEPIDDLDKIPCNANWAIGIYPAYALTDGADGANKHGGNLDEDVLVPEFKFDNQVCPMLFIHGDADVYSTMDSVKTWEKLRTMNVQCDLHTLVKRGHCFQRKAAEGTGSYTWLNRIWEFMTRKGFNK